MRTLLLLLLSIFFTVAQATPIEDFFDKADLFFKEKVKENGIDYQALENDPQLKELIYFVETADVNQYSQVEQKAFMINAYNLLVINGVVTNLPINSVLNVNGFFENKKIRFANDNITLNQLEKDRMLKVFKDPRLHFVLVCGAVDCPPLIAAAYRPETLEAQLNTQTRLALNDPQFIKIDETEQKVMISQIFDWYRSDFGGGKSAAVAYINEYRETTLPADYKVSFYKYDWALNTPGARKLASIQQGNNSIRYVVSSAIPKGSSELKIFNNLYSQQTGSPENLVDRSTFFTTSVSYLYGMTDRFNGGFELRYRRVRNDKLPSNPFDVLGGQGEATNQRHGVTGFGPKIRWSPYEKYGNFSIQSTLLFTPRNDQEGDGVEPFIDWNNPTWITQFFNDFTIGNNFSLFTEFTIFIEDIGTTSSGAANVLSTPATVIFSYFPAPKATIYALAGYAPFIQSPYSYFYQLGSGVKYQFTRKFEVELLYTLFDNRFLNETGGKAATYNLGVRFNM